MSTPFITIEGIDGCGKTTQIHRLKEAANAAGLDICFTREPGGTALADDIRALLLEGERAWHKNSEILLHFTARQEHLTHVIRPALVAKKPVICDRFVDSTLAYQAYGHGGDKALIEALSTHIIGNTMPNLTFWLDIPPETALARTQTRQHAEDRYEAMGLAFQQRVYAGFKALAAHEPQRIIRIDATHTIDRIHADITTHLLQIGLNICI